MTILPGVLAQIADVAGEPAALAIAKARGGTEVYIPPKPGPDHWLSKLLGLEAACAVASELTMGVCGLRVELPLGPAGHAAQVRARVDAMLRENRSESDIARATGYTIRGVRRRRAMLNLGRDDRQGELF